MRTKEKIEIKKYKTFPSMEWGENGGCCCDIYIGSKKVAEYFNEGNGGTPNIRTFGMTHIDLQDLCYEVNERLGLNEPLYGHDINYSCAIECLIDYLAEMKDLEKWYKKEVKKGKSFVLFGRAFGSYKWVSCGIDKYKEMKKVLDNSKENFKRYHYITSLDYFNNL